MVGGRWRRSWFGLWDANGEDLDVLILMNWVHPVKRKGLVKGGKTVEKTAFI